MSACYKYVFFKNDYVIRFLFTVQAPPETEHTVNSILRTSKLPHTVSVKLFHLSREKAACGGRDADVRILW